MINSKNPPNFRCALFLWKTAVSSISAKRLPSVPIRPTPFNALALTPPPPFQFVLNCADTDYTFSRARGARHDHADRPYRQTDRPWQLGSCFLHYPRIFILTDISYISYYLPSLALPPMPCPIWSLEHTSNKPGMDSDTISAACCYASAAPVKGQRSPTPEALDLYKRHY